MGKIWQKWRKQETYKSLIINKINSFIFLRFLWLIPGGYGYRINDRFQKQKFQSHEREKRVCPPFRIKNPA